MTPLPFDFSRALRAAARARAQPRAFTLAGPDAKALAADLGVPAERLAGRTWIDGVPVEITPHASRSSLMADLPDGGSLDIPV